MGKAAGLTPARLASVGRPVVVLLAIAAMVLAACSPAPPPAPADAVPAPTWPMQQTNLCADTTLAPGGASSQAAYPVDELHRIARGEGQVVAVLDSGVSKVSRLDKLRGAGDYIAAKGDGLSDCDSHGTLIAGIIAAQPKPQDRFVGVAPGAEIVSIRLVSAAFGRDTSDWNLDNPPQGMSAQEKLADKISIMARAIVHAANQGATVIAIPNAVCVPANSAADLRDLDGALRYAVNDRRTVVVAAAGGWGLPCQGGVPDGQAPRSGDSAAEGVTVLPAYFSDRVLTVAGVRSDGGRYPNTMPGPDITVAAPATDVVSLDPAERTPGGLVNRRYAAGTPTAIDGNGFAVAQVAGLVALIRQSNPSASPEQIIRRIAATAKPAREDSASVVGAGIVDPVAALSAPWR